MRILIIHTQYHPVINPNVFRWGAIAAYWASQGHDVHVLCSRRHGWADDTVLNGVQVHRAGHASLLDALLGMLGTQNRRGEAGGVGVAPKSNFRPWLEKVVNLTWRSIYWPDGSCIWYFSGRKRALELQRKYHFEAIISVTPPYTPHLIAAAIKRRFPKVRWLMDIEDPFAFAEAVFINNRFLYRQYNYHREEQLLAQADAASVTVATARQKYIQNFPNVRAKLSVIPPLFSLPDTTEVFPLEKAKIHLGYFGAFYHPIRTPDALLRLFYQLYREQPDFAGQLVLHVFGEIPPVFRAVFARYQSLLPNLRLHGLVPREKIAAAIRAMDFLVNVGNTTDYHLPSKCVDYLMSGKPIINLSYVANDPFVQFMEHYPLMLNLVLTQGWNQEIIGQLYYFILENRGRTVTPILLTEMIEPYTLEKIANQYFSLLQATAE